MHICIYAYVCITYICIYMRYENRQEDFLYIVIFILKLMFYVDALLSIYSTTLFKIHPMVM